MAESSLDKYRRPGSAPVAGNDDGEKNIKLREYKPFTLTESGERCSHLLVKPGTILEPALDEGFAYYALGPVSADGFGFVLNLTFGNPTRAVVEIHGEGLLQLTDLILRGQVAKIQTFDPERFTPVAAGHWNNENYEWKGPPLIKQIKITLPDSPPEPQKH